MEGGFGDEALERLRGQLEVPVCDLEPLLDVLLRLEVLHVFVQKLEELVEPLGAFFLDFAFLQLEERRGEVEDVVRVIPRHELVEDQEHQRDRGASRNISELGGYFANKVMIHWVITSDISNPSILSILE